MTIPVIPMEFAAADQPSDRGLVDKQKWLREWEKQNFSSDNEKTGGHVEQDARAAVLKVEGEEPTQHHFSAVQVDSELVYSLELARIQSANRVYMPENRQQPLAYRQAQPAGSVREVAAPAATVVDDKIIREPADSRKIRSFKQDIEKVLEKANFNVSNVHVIVKGKEVNLWFRDYRKGATRRIASTIEAAITLLKENGYTLAAVKLNGEPLREG